MSGLRRKAEFDQGDLRLLEIKKHNWHSGVAGARFCAIMEREKGENRYDIKTIKR